MTRGNQYRRATRAAIFAALLSTRLKQAGNIACLRLIGKLSGEASTSLAAWQRRYIITPAKTAYQQRLFCAAHGAHIAPRENNEENRCCATRHWRGESSAWHQLAA